MAFPSPKALVCQVQLVGVGDAQDYVASTDGHTQRGDRANTAAVAGRPASMAVGSCTDPTFTSADAVFKQEQEAL